MREGMTLKWWTSLGRKWTIVKVPVTAEAKMAFALSAADSGAHEEEAEIAAAANPDEEEIVAECYGSV